jgi:hypothetical protein
MSSTNIYTSPLCSCIECRTVFSQKSINTHFIRKHTNNSKRISHKGNSNKFTVRCSCIQCKKETTVQSLSAHIKSCNKNNETIFKICTKCNKTHSKPGTYCSRKCTNSRIISDEQKLKTSSTLKNKPKLIKPEKIKTHNIRICASCGLQETTNGRFQSIYCKFCNPSTRYRQECRFTFDLRNFPEEFDLTLLKYHGMFNPKTNPTGVSRDHLISVNYGKINRIDSSIISHPANCQLILQSENSKKHTKNALELDQLLVKIEYWNKKYNYCHQTT